VLLVFGIGEDLEQSLVARWAAAIFRRAASDGFKQKQARLALDRGRDLFELDGVFPAVAEVIKVAERLAVGVSQNGAETAFLGVQRSIIDAVGIGFAPTGAA